MHTALRLTHDAPTVTLLHEVIDLLDLAVRGVRGEAFDRRSQHEPQRVDSIR